eukprot:c11579_g1_i1 orf=1-318(-)
MASRGVQQFVNLKDVTHGVGNPARLSFANKIHQKSCQGEEEAGEVLDGSNDSYQNCQGDTGLVALLKACGEQKDLHEGSRLHAHVLKRGMLKQSIFIGSTLVSMYA